MTTTETRPAPTTRVLTPQLLGVALAYFMVLLDVTVLAVAEPDMITSLHTSAVGVGWATTSYTITFAALLMLAGRVSDRVGAHRVFRSGVIAFGVVSLGCAAAPDIGALVGARALLGCCAAAVVGASLPLIAQLYPDAALRARAVSIWASVSGAALALGPALGGLLVDTFGWRSVFVINAPLAVLVLITTVGRAVHCPVHNARIAVIPNLLAVGVLAAGTLAIVLAGRDGHRWWSLVALAVTIALVLLTRRADSRSVDPIVSAAIARSRPALLAFSLGAVVNVALTTVLFVFPLQHASGSAVRTGLLLLPLTLPLVLNPLLTGRMVARYGPFLPIRLGVASLAVGLGVLAVVAATGGPYVVVAVALACCGLGVSWSLPALVAFAVRIAPAGTTGSVGGLLNASRQVGATVAAAVAAATVSIGATGSFPLAAACGLCVLAVVAAAATKDRTR